MMRRVIPALLLATLVSGVLPAAVLYDFRQTFRSDAQGRPAGEVEGSGVIDGDRSRIDYTGGNLYPIGTYVIAQAGARQFLVVNPISKTYAEISSESMSQRLKSGEIEIANLKTRVEKMGQGIPVAGFPTEHWVIEMTYQVTWKGGPIPLTQNVQSLVERWTTAAFGDVAGTFLDQSALMTGDPKIDEIINAEMSKVKGFPLRIVTTVGTTGTGNLTPNTGSRLQVAPTRMQSSEMLLSNVRLESVPAARFEIPAGFTVADPTQRKKTDDNQMHVLSLETTTTNPK